MSISGDYRIDALLQGEAYRWNYQGAMGTPTVVPYAFMDTLPGYYAGIPANNIQPNLVSYNLVVIDEAHRALVRQEIQQLEAAIPGLKFFETTNPDAAVIRFGAYWPTATVPSSLQYDDASGLTPNTDSSPSPLQSGDLWFNTSSQKYDLAATYMGYTVQPTWFADMALHELGHTIGFKHPGNYSGTAQFSDMPPWLPANEDDSVNTVMSYNGDYAGPGPRPYDILAGRFLYGSTAGADWVLASDGNTVVEGSALNERIALAGGGQVVDAGGGVDVAVYSDSRAQHATTKTASGWTVSGSVGADTLTNTERLVFADASIALDVTGGNAGTTAKILGAVFGAASVSNKTYVGIGLNYLDNGMSYQDLMQLAIDASLGAGASHLAVVNLLYTNVAGVAPPAADRDYFVGLLDSGAYTVASLGVLAADHSLNAANINLTGLAQTGIEYI